MNAVRFRKRLDVPVPELPELTPMVRKEVEIIVLDDAENQGIPAPEREMTALEKYNATHGGPPPVANFEDLMGGWPEEERDDGFEEWVNKIRREPYISTVD
jgi:hypothetical protein